MAPDDTPRPVPPDPAGGPPPARRLTDLEQKRRQFEEAGKFPLRKVIVAAVAVLVLVVGGIVAYTVVQQSKEVGGGTAAGATPTPAGGSSSKNVLPATQDAETLRFAAGPVSQGIVQVDYRRTAPLDADYRALMGGDVLPLLAYVAPSGKLVVASSLCEPCRGTSFHIEGPNLVCDKCFTKWDLNTLAGVSGACQTFPPIVMQSSVSGDTVVVETAQLEAWTPRAY